MPEKAKISVGDLSVQADNHQKGSSLEEGIQLHNDYILRSATSNSTLYKENYFLNSWLSSYACDQKDIVILRFFDRNQAANNGCFGFLCLKVSHQRFSKSYVNAGFLFGYPGPSIIPGREFDFFSLLNRWLSQESYLYSCTIGPTRDPLHQFPNPGNLGNFLRTVPQTSAPYIDLSMDYVPPSENLRKNLKKKSNLLKTQNFEFKYCYDTSDEMFSELFENWILMLKRRWPRGHFSLDEKRHRSFHLSLANQLSKLNSFIFASLYIEGQPAAIIFGIVQGNRFYYFNSAMNIDFQAFSPSILLIQELIRTLPEKGVDIFDFMNDMEPYKLQWTTKTAARYSYEICSHFFLRHRFQERWGPKYFFPRLFRIRNLVRLISNPVSSIRYFLRHN